MSQSLKERVAALIRERKFDELAELIARERKIMRYLYRLLYSTEGIMRWRAIEGMGVVARRLAQEDPDAVRNIIRSLFWSINDESGGIGWSAPESIGEIIYHLPAMFGEFASIILSYSDEQMLRRGVVWAAGRIAQAAPDLVRQFIPEFTAFLDDPDPVVRGYILRFLYFAGNGIDLGCHRNLLQDFSPVPVYENGELKETTVAGLAACLVNVNKEQMEIFQ
ncbi:HEAT repeat domain-containing protein [Desulfallas sp. Bu1-1]|jgi:hypothetical protein|uniref:DVU0298 family protein n=1 Tax=Desulfallas sp. Bu1-1 TaxID=2787620 RepID=UPI0018A021B3|nr:DVU0298 family protein [Desulfallas sp. Bu1-1]MBF7083951.1 HEAT repeat domain-containing protein [Desulfallas sp. Bu1-1]